VSSRISILLILSFIVVVFLLISFFVFPSSLKPLGPSVGSIFQLASSSYSQPTLVVDSLTFSSIGQTLTTRVSLQGTLSNGLSGGKIKITVPSNLATITKVDFNSQFELTNVEELSLPASEIQLQFVDLSGDFPSNASNTNIATLTIKSIAMGEGTIQPSVISPPGIQNFDGNEFSVLVNSGTLRIQTSPPIASIVSINPNPALVNQTITFVGSGRDPDGNVVAYKWWSNGVVISTQANFTKSDFSPGTYQIEFKVKDNSDLWSEAAIATLVVNQCPTIPGQSKNANNRDGDSVCEDANGNGLLDFADLRILFLNMLAINNSNTGHFFDCQLNNKILDFADLRCFFKKISRQ
jgi:hypothetical protein